MFHSRGLRRLPPDIQLEIETLIADLRGEKAPPLRAEAIEASELVRQNVSAYLPRILRLRRSIGGSRVNESG
jgi:uncharacterized protein DUF3309